MHSSLRLFWTGLSVLALGVAGCGGSSSIATDGGDGGKTDGSKTDGSKTDGAKTDSAKTEDAKGDSAKTDGAQADEAKADGASTDAHDGGKKDVESLDLGGVTPPAMLTATVLDRRATTFELVWTAPSNNGAAVSGYQVRYAKVPITTANFDDTTVTTAATYTGTPKAPGDTDGTIVKAYIENGYYFAVTGTDGTGAHVGAFMATAAAVTAHFNVTTLTGTSGLTNEQFGYQLDGSGDVNGDGYSDILAGSTTGQHAYLFFGALGTFNPSAPAVVFSGDGTTSYFGYAVAQIGDIDKDGREDIAIADVGSSPPRVFIFKGRATWPITMGPSNADYVIAGDSTYNGSILGVSMARLGDFNGDGIDDFAMGSSSYASHVGRVVVVLGKTGFGNITLPDTANSITIDGDSSLVTPLFGARVVGIGRFYSVNAGTTLVVSSPGVSTATSSQGHLYAFHGQTGSAGAIALASADNVLMGPAAGSDIGSVLANLGPMVNSLPSVGSGNPLDTASSAGISGSVYVFAGNTTGGAFSAQTNLTQSGATRNGQVLIGGCTSGRNTSYSMLGSARPDLILVPQTGPSIQIIDGDVVAGLGTVLTDVGTIATATISLPSGWSNTGQGEGVIIPDINGDGYPDFAIANAINAVQGTIGVYW